MTADVYNYIYVFDNGYKIHQIWQGCFTRKRFCFVLQYSSVLKSWKIFRILFIQLYQMLFFSTNAWHQIAQKCK